MPVVQGSSSAEEWPHVALDSSSDPEGNINGKKVRGFRGKISSTYSGIY